jgi:hypothetical protein
MPIQTSRRKFGRGSRHRADAMYVSVREPLGCIRKALVASGAFGGAP